MNRLSAAGDQAEAQEIVLMPLLGTAKRVKRSLTPVRPSLAFQASLEGELLDVARRLALSRGNAPRTAICITKPAAISRHQVAAILGGIAAVSMLVALVLLMNRTDRERRPS